MSEIEKQFFETFEIKKKEYTQCLSVGCRHPDKNCCNCENYEIYKVDYPQITDHILLKLIYILNKHYFEQYQIVSMIAGKNIEEVKKSILNDCIEESKHKDFKQQIQELFKEDN